MTTRDYTVSLPVFEGPLDLLLHLVKKHELDVLDIPVSFVTEKYLEYLDLMRQTNLDIAGEYLLMAATLVHLKSRELLPSPEPLAADETDGDEELDPRQELIRRLLEYQKYKEAAAELDDRPVIGRNVWTRGAALESDDPGGAGPPRRGPRLQAARGAGRRAGQGPGQAHPRGDRRSAVDHRPHP